MLGEEFKAQYLADCKKEQQYARHKAYYAANKEKIVAQRKVYNTANKERKAAVDKAYRIANKEKINNRQRAFYDANKVEIQRHEKSKRDERNLMLFNYKGAACHDCGVSEPDSLEIYDYHHVDPSTKLHTIAAIMMGPIDRLLAEADKCVLFCACCHRKEHARLNRIALTKP